MDSSKLNIKKERLSRYWFLNVSNNKNNLEYFIYNGIIVPIKRKTNEFSSWGKTFTAPSEGSLDSHDSQNFSPPSRDCRPEL